MCLVLPLNVFFNRYHPADKGLTVDGIPDAGAARVTAQAAPRPVEWTLKAVFRSSTFWYVLASHILTAVILLIVMIHQFAFLTDLGLARTFAAVLISLVGLFNISGQVLGGFICDRVGSETAYSVHSGAIIVALVLLMLLMLLRPSGNEFVYYLYAVIFGFGAGGLGVITVVATAEIFQGPQYAAIQGILSMGWGIGAGIGPILAGWIFDVTHSYQIAFAVAILVTIASSASLWLAAPRAFRRRRQVPAA